METKMLRKTIAYLCGAVAPVLLWAGGAAAQPRPLPPLPADAPAPPAGRSMAGTWIAGQRLEALISRDKDGQPTPLNAEGQRILDARLAATSQGFPFSNASAVCRPPGPPWQMDLAFPFQIHEVADRLEFIFEEYHGVMTVFLDPADTPSEARYSGVSIGHWEGDTLVVETSNFRQPLWLDVSGTPASTDARLTQRYTKVTGERPHLLVEYTIDDPRYYSRPWSWTRIYLWRPDQLNFLEYNCEEQVGDPNYIAQSGLVVEPD